MDAVKGILTIDGECSSRRSGERMASWVSVLLFALLVTPAYGQTLRIYHIDVDQGDATLFVSPSGRTLLVDSGKNGHGSRIKAVMDQAQVSQIDHFVATHYHEDHYGGIDELTEQQGITVVQAYDRGDKAFLPASKRQETTFRDYQRAVGEDATQLRRGMTIPLDPAMTVTCISSGGVVIGEDPPAPGRHENDMSVSLLMTFGTFRYFIGGDIHEDTESKIAARDLVTNVDVYQANHHGSHTSSSQAFMADLSPTVIIASNGSREDYQHPRRTTLNRYAGLPGPPTVFQTNKYLGSGSLGGANVPDAFIADPQTVDADGTILLTVDGAAARYTVSYGQSTRTFQIKTAGAPVIVIESLLPNPVGDDRVLEEVTLHNRGSAPVSVVGWRLRDRSGDTWSLASLGTIPADASSTIRRNGMSMSLNNTGDEITLLDPADVVRDSFAYTSSAEGVRIATGH